MKNSITLTTILSGSSGEYFVTAELSRGGLITLKDSVGLQRALSVTTNIKFMSNKVKFTLEKK